MAYFEPQKNRYTRFTNLDKQKVSLKRLISFIQDCLRCRRTVNFHTYVDFEIIMAPLVIVGNASRLRKQVYEILNII